MRVSRHAWTRRTAREHVQLHFTGEARALRSPLAAAAGDGGRGVRGDVAAVRPAVLALRAAVDCAREIAAGATAAGALQRAERAAADGAVGLQLAISVVRGLEHG